MHTASYWAETSFSFGSGQLWSWLPPITLSEHAELLTKQRTLRWQGWQSESVKKQSTPSPGLLYLQLHTFT